MKNPFTKLYKKALDTTFTKEEIKNSTRISKSATPKYTIDWYVKWVASSFVLAAMSLRGIPEYQETDLILSVIGITLWLWVSVIWRDRALILLNGAGLLFLMRNLLELWVPVSYTHLTLTTTHYV